MVRIIAIGIILMFLSASAFANGMAIAPCTEGWCPYRESSQRAIINYENGKENLLLFVKTENIDSEKFLWIFPIPAKPEQITIDNLKSFPNLAGTQLKKQFRDNIGGLAAINLLSLISPAAIFIAPFWFMETVNYSVMTSDNELGAARQAIDTGYVIYDHIDKYGIATEVITATDSEKFYHYLEVRGTNVSPDAKKRLDEYIGKDYSFIVSWISNPEEYRQQRARSQGTAREGIAQSEIYYPQYYNQEPIGVFVKFPAEKIYYPMKLTSVYEENYVPATIDIIGYKEPEIFANISRETKTEYYFQDRLRYGLNEEESARAVFNGNIPQQIRFTRITINAQAKYFIQDLEISPGTSILAGLFEAANALWLLIAAIIFFALAFAAMWLANKFVLEGFLGNKKIAILALANFLTIVGFVVAVFAMKESLGAKDRQKFSRLRAIIGYWAIAFGMAIVLGLIAIGIGMIIK